MALDAVKITDELELWTYPDGRTVLHVEAEETATQARMFGEVDLPSWPSVAAAFQAAAPPGRLEGWLEMFLDPDQPAREPVTHEATDPELWDTDTEVYALACSCGTWETRGTTAEISHAFEAHLDAMGVPANELERQERIAAQIGTPELERTEVQIRRTGGGFNWNRIILAVLATQATEPDLKAEAYAALHKAQDELIAEILASRTAGPIRVSAAGLEAIARRMSPGDRAELAGLLETDVEREAARLGAEAVDALGDVAEAMGMDPQSIVSHSPAELGVMLVATIQHRERVKHAHELAAAVGQFPEILASASTELRAALRAMLADAADALAEPEPAGVWHQEAAAAGVEPRYHQAGGRCWCRVAHGQAEAIELNTRLSR